MGKFSDLFKAAPKWSCRYWRMEEPFRTIDHFYTQEEAQVFSESKQQEGYLTLVGFDSSPSGDSFFIGLVKILISAFTKSSTVLTEHTESVAEHVRKHIATGKQD